MYRLTKDYIYRDNTVVIDKNTINNATEIEPTEAERVIGLRAWDKELEMFHDEVVAIDFRLRKIRVFSRSEDDYPSDWLPLERFVLYGINAPDEKEGRTE